MSDLFLRYAGPVRPESTNTTNTENKTINKKSQEQMLTDTAELLNKYINEASKNDSFTMRYAGPQRPEASDDSVKEADENDSFTIRYAGPQRPEKSDIAETAADMNDSFAIRYAGPQKPETEE